MNIHFSNNWNNISKNISKKELIKAIPFLEFSATVENKPYKGQPEDIKDYKFRTNFKDAGMGSYLIHHNTENIFEELNIKCG